MELPFGYSEKFQATATAKKPRSEREELLDKFLERLNPPRIRAKLQPLSIGRLVKIFEGTPTSDLYPFLKRCENARDFGRMFWWSFKPKA